jgi:hypothetical protein
MSAAGLGVGPACTLRSNSMIVYEESPHGDFGETIGSWFVYNVASRT